LTLLSNNCAAVVPLPWPLYGETGGAWVYEFVFKEISHGAAIWVR